MLFKDLNIHSDILRALEEEGYSKATPIQERAIPIVLQGTDLLACAQTGTGKTAAFSVPIIQLLGEKIQHPKNIRSLIVTPTRELAIQIGESMKAYGRHTDIKHTVIFGGVSQHAQVEALKRRPDVLIATPGRLLDLMQQGYISLKSIEIFVLDEADRMLDMGFIHDIKKLLKELPQKRQSLFFSATMPAEIVKLSENILFKPEKVEVNPVSSTAETIAQSVYLVEKTEKSSFMLEMIKNPQINSVLVFTKTKHGADKVVKFLVKNNVKAMAIHGNKSQNARQNALNQFKNNTLKVLVATDIAARGIDVEELEYVINYELPNVPETYVHRIGRSGRAGNKGNAISFCSLEERPFLRDIERLTKIQIPCFQVDSKDLSVSPVKKSETLPNLNKNSNFQSPNQGPIKNKKSSHFKHSKQKRKLAY
jgi:ATP-dependent RNA helicase RhlE